jgi:peptidyl-prolyl cis-trans isomerase SurA
MISKFIQGSLKAAFVLLSLWALGLSAQAQDQQVVVDKIIAKVDNYIVLKSELEMAYLEFLSRGQISSGRSSKCQVLESLIINKLMVAKAEIDSVVVSDAEVRQNLDRRMQYYISQIGSEKMLEEYYKKTIEEFKEELRDGVKEQLVVQKMQNEITAKVKVTPAEVKRFFKSIPADSLPFFSTEVEVSQIVKKPTISKVEKEKVKQKLNEIRAQILRGEATFEEMAKKHSEEPGASQSGGNIGFFKRGELAPEYEAAALRMKPGEISQPVETQFGFHLVQLIERRGNQFNTRHILIAPNPSKADLLEAKSYLDSLKTEIENGNLSFEKAAKEYSDDQETAGAGGYFQDDLGLTRISVEELDPVIFFAIDTMQVGTITPPMTFRTREGKESARILYFKSKLRPHQANLRDDYQKIYAAALNEKKNKVLTRWFDEANNDVFIDIDEEYERCNILKDN